MRSASLILLSTLALTVAAAACGGKKGAGGGSTPTPTPTPSGQVQVHAKILHGPSSTGAAFAPSPFGPPPAPPTNGHWLISPDAAKLTVVSITFAGTNGNVQSAQLTNCTPTYVQSSAALSQLADCPFSIPAGSYNQISIGVLTTAEILVSDAANGFYTTTSASTGVSTSAPVGGAQFVKMVVPGPGGTGNVLTSESFFPTFFTVDSANAPTFNIIVDMMHTVYFNVSGSTVTIDTSLPQPPANLVASLPNTTGRYEFYSPTGTSKNTPAPGPTDNDSGSVRLFYANPPQPSDVFHPVVGPSQAYDADPRGGTGNRAGGWLGLDNTGTACWALATDDTYGTYAHLCEMVVTSTIGAATTLQCQDTSNVPPPTSGSTYASGCPAITPSTSTPVTLVAH